MHIQYRKFSNCESYRCVVNRQNNHFSVSLLELLSSNLYGAYFFISLSPLIK